MRAACARRGRWAACARRWAEGGRDGVSHHLPRRRLTDLETQKASSGVLVQATGSEHASTCANTPPFVVKLAARRGLHTHTHTHTCRATCTQFARAQCGRSSICKMLPLWREIDGKRCFTGIVVGEQQPNTLDAAEYASSFTRLDDDQGPLDGPGHSMTEPEFLSQMSMYDESEVPRAPLMQSTFCGRRVPDQSLERVDLAFFDAYYEQANFAPLEMTPSHVRAGDCVVVRARGEITRGPNAGKYYSERFWADVVSATPCGKINAISRNSLNNGPIEEGSAIWFPIGAVLAAKRGVNWE